MSLQDFDQLWDYNDPAATEEKFRQQLRSAAGKGAEYVLCLRTQIARALGLQKRFDEANALLDTVDAANQKTALCQVRSALERGRLRRSSGDKAGSKPFFLQALELAQKSQLDFFAGRGGRRTDERLSRPEGLRGRDLLVCSDVATYFSIDALHMMGIIEPEEDWNQRAIALAEASTEPTARRWLGSLYNNVGWNFHDKGQFEEALAIFQKGVIYRESANQAKELHVARWCVARTLRSLQRYEEALALQQELAAGLLARNDEDGFVSEEIGECLLALGLTEEAKPHFRAAHQALSKDQWIEPERLQRLQTLAEPSKQG